MNPSKTYFVLTSVDPLGNEYQMSIDECGGSQLKIQRGEKVLDIRREIGGDNFLKLFQEFYKAIAFEACRYSESSVFGFWFFQLFVGGLLVKYHTGPILKNNQSPFKGLDKLIQEKLVVHKFFTVDDYVTK